MAVGCPLLGLIVVSILSGCAKDDVDSAESTFAVQGAYPDPGATDVVVSAQPELRLNADADPETCTTESLVFAAVREDGTVLFRPDHTIEVLTGTNKIIFSHDTALPADNTYVLVVETAGDWVCTDTDGRLLEPFGMEFTVP